jgi:hypothetical protein
LGKDVGGNNTAACKVFLEYRSDNTAYNNMYKLVIDQSVNQFIPVYRDWDRRQLGINTFADNQLENISLSNHYKFLVNGGLLTTTNYMLSVYKIINPSVV